jgi:hypothetical protein
VTRFGWVDEMEWRDAVLIDVGPREGSTAACNLIEDVSAEVSGEVFGPHY